MVMTLPDSLVSRLCAIAAQQQRSPEAVLEQLLTDYELQIQSNLPVGKDKPPAFGWVSKSMDGRIDITDKDALYAELDRDENT